MAGADMVASCAPEPACLDCVCVAVESASAERSDASVAVSSDERPDAIAAAAAAPPATPAATAAPDVPWSVVSAACSDGRVAASVVVSFVLVDAP